MFRLNVMVGNFPKFNKRDVPNKSVMVGKNLPKLINVQHVYWELQSTLRCQYEPVEQTWANYGPRTTCGPFAFFIRPAKDWQRGGRIKYTLCNAPAADPARMSNF